MRTLYIALLTVLCLPLAASDAFAKDWDSLTMHPYWQPKPSNTIRWTVLP